MISKYYLCVSNNNNGDVFMLVTITKEMPSSVNTIPMLVTITYHLNWHVLWTCI